MFLTRRAKQLLLLALPVDKKPFSDCVLHEKLAKELLNLEKFVHGNPKNPMGSLIPALGLCREGIVS